MKKYGRQFGGISKADIVPNIFYRFFGKVRFPRDSFLNRLYFCLHQSVSRTNVRLIELSAYAVSVLKRFHCFMHLVLHFIYFVSMDGCLNYLLFSSGNNFIANTLECWYETAKLYFLWSTSCQSISVEVEKLSFIIIIFNKSKNKFNLFSYYYLLHCGEFFSTQIILYISYTLKNFK